MGGREKVGKERVIENIGGRLLGRLGKGSDYHKRWKRGTELMLIIRYETHIYTVNNGVGASSEFRGETTAACYDELC